MTLRLLVAGLLFVFIALQYQLWFGGGGLTDLIGLQRRVAKQAEHNRKLSERNLALRAEVIDLKKGFEAIEERGRADLGLVKPGETFFQVIDTKKK